MKIVLIDDSDSALTFMAGLVRSLPDCEAVTFPDASKALPWCLDNEVDMIIVDYIMPVLDGLGFIEALRADTAGREIPVIMVTSSEARDIRYAALQTGATDFLTKPLDPVEFLARVRNLLNAHRAHKALGNLSHWLAVEIDRATRSLIAREREAILFLARAAEYRDPETGLHLVRMAEYSRLIASKMGLSPQEVESIHTAAPLHDVGKVGIPDSILLKPGALTPEETRIMRLHARYGADILAGSTSPLLHQAAEIAHCHHEWVDGTGYPRGLKGDEIPLAARIVALADVFDALTSRRPYKEPWPLDRAIAHIERNRGRHFDPVCVDAFFQIRDEVTVVMDRHAEDGRAPKAGPAGCRVLVEVKNAPNRVS